MIILSVANLHQTQKLPNYFSTANLPTTWTISPNTFGEDHYRDHIILSNRKPNSSYGIGFGCGFYSNIHTRGLFHFGVGIVETSIDGSGKQVWHFKERIWLADRNRLVGNNATLQFKEDGNLELRDFDGSYVWSTNTSGKPDIVGMKMMETGNLVLYDKAYSTIWQSFDHPTDTLMMGQKLEEGQTLVGSVWQHNMSEGNYRLSVTSQGMSAYYKAHNVFKQVLTYKASVESSLVLAYNASVLNLTMHFGALPKPYLFFGSPTNYSMMSHIKLDHDGHLRIYGDDSESYSISPNLLKDCYNGVCLDDGSHMLDECSYPTSCGEYGVCSNDGSCSCLPRFVDAEKLLGVLGCWLSYPNMCKNASLESFFSVHDGNYYVAYGENIVKTNKNDCAKACLKSCSCKLALFQQFADSATEGDCVLPTPPELSLKSYKHDQSASHPVGYRPSLLLIRQSKVEETSSSVLFPKEGGMASPNESSHKGAIIGLIVGMLLLLIVGCSWILFLRNKRKRNVSEGTELEFHELLGRPFRFSYEQLKIATGDFKKMIGRGFG